MALEKHGYSELSMQKIADEFDKSKSLLYHHYDGKEEILLDFLDHQLQVFREKAEEDSEEDVKEAFEEKAFMAFEEETGMKWFIEIRTEGLRDERFRKRFQDFSRVYREKLQSLMKKGKEKGVFHEVDVEKVSRFIDALNKEAIFRAANCEDTGDLRDELHFYLEKRVMR